MQLEKSVKMIPKGNYMNRILSKVGNKPLSTEGPKKGKRNYNKSKGNTSVRKFPVIFPIVIPLALSRFLLII